MSASPELPSGTIHRPIDSGDDRSSSNPGDIPRRQRFSHEQVVTLDTVFREDPYPGRERKWQLARQFRTSVERIRNWFDNKRQTVRRRGSKSAMPSGELPTAPACMAQSVPLGLQRNGPPPSVPFPHSISDHLTTGSRDLRHNDPPENRSSSSSSGSSNRSNYPRHEGGGSPVNDSSAPRLLKRVHLMDPKRLARKIERGIHVSRRRRQ